MSEESVRGTVGVVIVHFHREQDIARLVADLVRDGIAEQDVVIVDNGSTAHVLSAELAARDLAPLVLTPGNVGYAAGMNLGVAALPRSVDTLLLLTHEVELSPGSIDALVSGLKTDPTGVVGPLLLTNPSTIWSAGGTLDGVRRLPGHYLRGADPAAAGSAPIDCAWLDGAVIALGLETWHALGGMDERYFLYAEDVDLGMCAHKAGRGVRVIPAARAVQAPSGAIDPYLWTRNQFLLFRKHRAWLAWMLWLASCLAGVLRDIVTLRATGTRVGRRLRAILDGIFNRSGDAAVVQTKANGHVGPVP